MVFMDAYSPHMIPISLMRRCFCAVASWQPWCPSFPPRRGRRLQLLGFSWDSVLAFGVGMMDQKANDKQISIGYAAGEQKWAWYTLVAMRMKVKSKWKWLNITLSEDATHWNTGDSRAGVPLDPLVAWTKHVAAVLNPSRWPVGMPQKGQLLGARRKWPTVRPICWCYFVYHLFGMMMMMMMMMMGIYIMVINKQQW